MIGGKNLEGSGRGVILSLSLWNMAESTVERPINLHPDSCCPDRDSKRVTVNQNRLSSPWPAGLRYAARAHICNYM